MASVLVHKYQHVLSLAELWPCMIFLEKVDDVFFQKYILHMFRLDLEYLEDQIPYFSFSTNLILYSSKVHISNGKDFNGKLRENTLFELILIFAIVIFFCLSIMTH
ncbi:hypothetical protein CDL12_25596 [Handroanthus impetiginosus]|uniref:Uncharacterized protein n=1 Tax=Handroanthus impetiginosus TaxID=429701 RepID=A0A2G9G9C4_9LAMI|nr:hypothetical protein CDL12_25596 [Handroanthus impetiginosus]